MASVGRYDTKCTIKSAYSLAFLSSKQGVDTVEIELAQKVLDCDGTLPITVPYCVYPLTPDTAYFLHPRTHTKHPLP